MTADVQTLEKIDFRVSRQEMDSFRKLSGDTNPLHVDPAFAVGRGFAGPVVFGGLLIAQVSRLLGSRLPGHGCVWRSLSMKFRSPLYVDEPAQLTATVVYANEDLGLFNLKLRIEANGRTIAEGEAGASLAREGGHAG